MDNNVIKIRFATSEDVSLIYRFIHKKAEFDRGVGAYSGTIQTSEAKIRQTIECNCTHLAWTADARNTGGIKFYYRLGAEITERRQHRCFFQWIL